MAVEASKKKTFVICPSCKIGRWLYKQQTITKEFTGLCRVCANNIHSRENHPSWKGGRIKKDSGYIAIKIYPDNPYYSMADRHGYILEHRLVMAQHLGKPLTPDEQVHHKPPGTKDDIG